MAGYECCDSEINVLIGADYFYQICYDWKIIKITKSLYLCESLFGYSLCGYLEGDILKTEVKHEIASVLNLSVHKLQQDDSKFLWELESLGIKNADTNTSDMDRETINKFENNLKFVNNRYETSLLWKDEKIKVGNNYRIAKRRFDELACKLDKDDNLNKNYRAIVSDQEISGIVEECPVKIMDDGYFMPHKPDLNEQKSIKYHIRKYDNHSEVVKMLDSCLYVDDLVTGTESVEEAYYFSSTASDIFKEAGMNLRKFYTNSVKLRKLREENKLCDLIENPINSLKVLGLLWDINSDILHFDVQSFPDDWKLNPTKRFALKAMLKIFDPLGFIAPFSVRMKSLLQETWQRGLEWDDILPQDLKNEWESWCSEIEHLSKFKVPRKYFPLGIEYYETIEIHLFSDASPKAYGAVAYFRSITADDKIHINLIWSKCRVSPIKRLTIPRLELMGAVIAARMCRYLKNMFNFQNLDIFIWSDSTITLHWIKGSPLNWKPFVANRVSEIQSLTDPKIWNYIPGKENPSDLLTRGVKLSTLIENKLWLYGPEWLLMPKEKWPKPETVVFNEDVSNEKRANLISAQFSCAIRPFKDPLLKLENFNNLYKVYNITAWVLRFLNNINKSNTRNSGELTALEIEKAELYWLKLTQQSVFHQEIESLKREKSIDKDSSLFSLNPKLDENNLLVISGRLQCSDFSDKEKHPCILPNGDFAGPIYFKTKSGSEKSYIVLFTCAVTRAVHLEVATNLSTDTFILALKWFISRRGICTTIYSDNAKTFIKSVKMTSWVHRIFKDVKFEPPDFFLVLTCLCHIGVHFDRCSRCVLFGVEKMILKVICCDLWLRVISAVFEQLQTFLSEN